MSGDSNGNPPWIGPEEAAEALRSGTGRGVRVAVLDSGIERDHPALSRCRFGDDLAVAEENGRLAIKEGGGVDLYGHGTAVAGIIHRVAPEAELGSFRVLDARNRSRTEIICEGVRRAIDGGYHVLNCSFGCKGGVRFIVPFKNWVDEAYLKRIHVVAACGNRGIHRTEWPSHFSSVIAVNLARHPDTDADVLYYREGTLVDFAAPAEKVTVPWLGGSSRVDTGSSYAAPLVTGLIARVLSVAPRLHPDHMHELLRRVALPWERQ